MSENVAWGYVVAGKSRDALLRPEQRCRSRRLRRSYCAIVAIGRPIRREIGRRGRRENGQTTARSVGKTDPLL